MVMIIDLFAYSLPYLPASSRLPSYLSSPRNWRKPDAKIIICTGCDDRVPMVSSSHHVKFAHQLLPDGGKQTGGRAKMESGQVPAAVSQFFGNDASLCCNLAREASRRWSISIPTPSGAATPRFCCGQFNTGILPTRLLPHTTSNC